MIETITRRLASMPGVERVVLFGSRARGDHRPRADIDLAVGCTPDAWAAVEAYAEDEAPTLLRLDVVHLERAPQALREQIEREGRVLYARSIGRQAA